MEYLTYEEATDLLQAIEDLEHYLRAVREMYDDPVFVPVPVLRRVLRELEASVEDLEAI